jgi:hypothetical protein
MLSRNWTRRIDRTEALLQDWRQIGNIAPIRNVDLSTNDRGRGHDAIKGDDIDFRRCVAVDTESSHPMSPTDGSIVIYNDHVMPVVIMMVFGMHHHISLVSNHDFVSLYEGCKCQKSGKKKQNFHCHRIRLPEP